MAPVVIIVEHVAAGGQPTVTGAPGDAEAGKLT
jgi:hypothetical protein